MTDLFNRSESLISPDGLYRYWLRRIWDSSLPLCGWCLLNPSTADAESDDPTVRRMIGFARLWGCGGTVVCNVFAWRETDPKELRPTVNDIVGPENDGHIVEQLRDCEPVIVAWGEGIAIVPGRQIQVRNLLLRSGIEPKCLGMTKTGFPRHPVRLAYATELVPFGVKGTR